MNEKTRMEIANEAHEEFVKTGKPKLLLSHLPKDTRTPFVFGGNEQRLSELADECESLEALFHYLKEEINELLLSGDDEEISNCLMNVPVELVNLFNTVSDIFVIDAMEEALDPTQKEKK